MQRLVTAYSIHSSLQLSGSIQENHLTPTDVHSIAYLYLFGKYFLGSMLLTYDNVTLGFP